jgi:Asp-tRNA(Asn)/Glu-tRNA(Gln) amidotransferase A subunit family amidase
LLTQLRLSASKVETSEWVGLEVHAQITATASKLFSGAATAFGIGETTDPLAMYLNDVFAVPASLAGLPAMSVPGGLDGQGLPLGLHLIGNELDEQMVLNAGLAIEERAGFAARPERWW